MPFDGRESRNYPVDGGFDKYLGAISFAKSALQGPVWPIIRNILLPSRHKNTDLGAIYFQN